MEGYLVHSKFRLAGLDFYASTLAATNESLEQFVQLFNRICARANVIAVDSKLICAAEF